MNRLAAFLIGVSAGFALVAFTPRHDPAVRQALLERQQVRYLN